MPELFESVSIDLKVLTSLHRTDGSYLLQRAQNQREVKFASQPLPLLSALFALDWFSDPRFDAAASEINRQLQQNRKQVLT